MALKLSKGEGICLTKSNDNLVSVYAALGWDSIDKTKRNDSNKSVFDKLREAITPKYEIDCDAFAFLLKNGRLADMDDIVYFKNLSHKSGCVKHTGDNLTGAGDGDDEIIKINLHKLNTKATEYNKIIIGVNIYECKVRNQHFGMIQNAFIRIIDEMTNEEICRYNLSDNYEGMTSVIFGELIRQPDDTWRFNAIGEGNKAASIRELTGSYM